jgi:hypothetical protein
MASIVVNGKKVELDTVPASISDKALGGYASLFDGPYRGEADYCHVAQPADANVLASSAEIAVAEALAACANLRIGVLVPASQLREFIAKHPHNPASALSIAHLAVDNRMASLAFRCRSFSEIAAACANYGPVVMSLQVGVAFFPFRDGFATVTDTSIGILTVVVWAVSSRDRFATIRLPTGEFVKISESHINARLEDAVGFFIPLPASQQRVISKAQEPVQAAVAQPEPEPKPEQPAAIEPTTPAVESAPVTDVKLEVTEPVPEAKPPEAAVEPTTPAEKEPATPAPKTEAQPEKSQEAPGTNS